jgi:hypothetical protein
VSGDGGPDSPPAQLQLVVPQMVEEELGVDDEEVKLAVQQLGEVQVLQTLVSEKVGHYWLPSLLLACLMCMIFKVIEQLEGIQGIHTSTVRTRDDLVAGNEMIQQAVDGFWSLRRISAWCLVMMALTLLLLHWWYP